MCVQSRVLFYCTQSREYLRNCVFLELFAAGKMEHEDEKEEIIADKFSLLETILIGFFLLCH